MVKSVGQVMSVIVVENVRAISMKTKVAIIKKLDCGEKMADVPRAYGMNRSNIGTISDILCLILI